MITIVLSPVSSSLKTTEYHPNANFTRLISGFSGSVRHPDILCSYTCVYVTDNIYIYIYIHIYAYIYIHTYIHIYIHTWIHIYRQTDIDTLIHRYISYYAKIGFISLFLPFTNFQYRIRFLSQLRTAFTFILHREVYPIFKI